MIGSGSTLIHTARPMTEAERLAGILRECLTLNCYANEADPKTGNTEGRWFQVPCTALYDVAIELVDRGVRVPIEGLDALPAPSLEADLDRRMRGMESGRADG